MTDIKVTQEDREAERETAMWWPYIANRPSEQGKIAARHRIEAQRPLLEALEMARRGLTADDVEPLEAMSILIMVDAAIKQAKGE